MENVKSFGKEIKTDAENLTTIVQNAVRDSVQSIKENFSEYYEKGKEGAKEWEKKAEGKIKEYPLQSLLIAAGVGLVFGLLCHKKKACN